MTSTLPARILITGSEGLIGRVLRERLDQHGVETRGFDLQGRGAERGDITDRAALSAALQGVGGVVHLAAVSRVIWGERDPIRCQRVNGEGTRDVLETALQASGRPWVVIASSREVYGSPSRLPVREDAPLEPINIYARAKVDGERAALRAAEAGLKVGILRFSNVYGRTSDHADRVIPAFARAAAFGGSIRVEGSGHLFDFTHVDDVTEGILRALLLRHEERRAALPALHLVSGSGTTLGQLAALTQAATLKEVTRLEAPPRSFDVPRFVGDPNRAASLLGWRATTPLSAGFARLVGGFVADACLSSNSTPRSGANHVST